ncbi:MAG TPA: DUF6265 family protein [Ignavibacteriaceae bacterium]|nr:DUF6265 family protein [Ignavibacteriaceae bacterium]
MRTIKTSILVILIFLLPGMNACKTQKQETENLTDFNRLKWINNFWQGEQGDAKITENWNEKNPWLMEGISYTTDKTGNRVFSQNMLIEQIENKIYFVIILPGNQRQKFELDSISDTSAVFKNEEDTYPLTIKYMHTSKNSMIVLLQGENEGKMMNTELKYAKQ